MSDTGARSAPARGAAAPCGRPSRVRIVLLILAASLVGAAAGGARAQGVQAPQPAVSAAAPGAPPDTAPRAVTGRVVRVAERGTVPVPGVWVTLHRVGRDSAGPLDSVRTGAAGGYQLRYRRSGAADALYFVSVRYGGVAYFSLPLGEPRVTGAAAELTVFDTTSRPFPLTVRGQHLVVSAPNARGVREVMEVYELSNDSARTLVPASDSAPVWSAIMLPRGSGFRAGQGDFAPQAIIPDSGRVLLSAPFAPGIKQLSFSYQVPARDFPASVLVAAPTQLLEILTEEPRASVRGAGLQAAPSVTVEGRTFARYLARDVPGNTVVRISVPAVRVLPRRFVMVVALAIGAAMLAALAAWSVRGRRATAPLAAAGEPPDHPDQLARAIAVLDRDFERRTAPSPAERARYERERGELKQRLATALEGRRARR